ncbi:hypothetical protein QJS10_CPA10g01817 [Acorus calamus]|uniref:BAH domain-containing protein n=1 Tax=Acorus calamus TaxID=4465 RepID=A0AAV9E097_ACOCL|nr:hypothetical protein QJS10_CPA10g01817 [Acorus calamus]
MDSEAAEEAMETEEGVRCFVEWEERFVSQERGNRVVHYFLKDSEGESVLAVVGTERSLRHMVYVVPEEFSRAHGTYERAAGLPPGFKWRSRREVVDWLTSLLSWQPGLHDLRESSDNPSELLGTNQMAGLDHPGSCSHKRMGHFARSFRDCNWDIMWSGSAWTCGKQLKHYQGFCRNGITIAVYSFVSVMAEEDNSYLAYLEDMYEDRKGQKKVKVRWFHQSQEVSGPIPPPAPHPKEVFITPYTQVISVECVDDLASVFTPEHFEKCLASCPHISTAKMHFCFRQYNKNKFKPFDISTLRGYYDQMVLSCLDICSISNRGVGEEIDELVGGGTPGHGSKKNRSLKGRLGVKVSRHAHQMAAYRLAYQNLKFRLPGRKPLSVKFTGPPRQLSHLFKVGEKIELLCQDSGIRGCWFRCIVLQLSQNKLKVQYQDVENEDGSGNLEEWVPAFRTAIPDRLGMRFSGRSTIRPWLPYESLKDCVLEIGTPVDAWWNDGWWEGVLTGVDNFGDDALQVYFPGEDIFMNCQSRNLRRSKDWVGNNWIEIKTKLDVLSAISAISTTSKIISSSVIGKGAESGGSAMSDREAPTTPRLDLIEEDNKERSDGSQEDVELINSRKRREEHKKDDQGNCDETVGKEEEITVTECEAIKLEMVVEG